MTEIIKVGSENYLFDENGVLRQIDPDVINYDKTYVEDRYNKYGELGPRMAYLRLGYLLGVIGDTPLRLLDVGYGNGDFLRAAADIVPEVYGNDIPPMYPISPIPTVHDIFAEDYDVVCFFDALEHFENPYIIEKLKTKFIYISVPNLGDNFNVDEFLVWRHRRPNEHLSHFNADSLKAFFAFLGYRCISLNNLEDTIRKNTTQKHSNIISAIFEKV